MAAEKKNILSQIVDLFNAIRDFFKAKFAGVTVGEFVTLGMLSSVFTALYVYIAEFLGFVAALANPIVDALLLVAGSLSGVKALQAIGRQDLVVWKDENRAFLVALIAALAFSAVVVQFPAVPMATKVAQTVVATIFP